MESGIRSAFFLSIPMATVQTQTQTLQQRLSPQQLQTIQLLELPLSALEQTIKEEIEKNVALEESERTAAQESEKENISMEEYLSQGEKQEERLFSGMGYSKESSQKSRQIASGVSIQESLMSQISFCHLSELELKAAEFIIGSIDERGYLREGLKQIADDLAVSASIIIPIPRIEEIIETVKHLDPLGVGCRNIREYLMLQLEQKSVQSQATIDALDILDEYFEEFSKKQFTRIMQRMSISEKELREAVEEIQRLNPSPLGGMDDSDTETAQYITPDFILNYQEGEFSLELNSRNIPELKVNRRYMDDIRSLMDKPDRMLTREDKEAIQYVKGKMDAAKVFINAIRQRQETLLKTMRTILDLQQEYFRNGDISRLKPMILNDIAQPTGLDISTVSRVVNNKYVQTHFGIILLKNLFSEGLQTNSGEEVTSLEVMEIIKQCISQEDKRKPLTDEQLTTILKGKGYCIARRTIAKYRDELGIQTSRLRKQI